MLRRMCISRMSHVIQWAVNGGFADMFLRSSNRYAISVLRHQMQLYLVYSQRLL